MPRPRWSEGDKAAVVCPLPMGAVLKPGQRVTVVRAGHGFVVVSDADGEEWVVGYTQLSPVGGI